MEITSKEALSIVIFQTYTTEVRFPYQKISTENNIKHIAIHAYANWGQNNHIAHPFIRRMSKITVLYNYFGGTSFAESCKLFQVLGIFSFDFGPLHSWVLTSFHH